ncbi:hypothetical protein [Clostridium botulinum]|uniref:hypothetical protein n=1 Tax=Clostridium botulinum TaxID=1491 RepID=UPI000773E3DD|nr:hypothetical protein [Clostridium botulinum]APH20812.1 hypothetical protein NPD1_4154 [Clostridium botulinum]APQ71175.1 hypothetical protein RSJ8_4111 [Clostridium botulinum]MBN3367042.1 hypothetical protein [Clostridium botulinum]MBN3371678.1 hypothetical protein [Clostridium botulinum]MBN3375516.1 hypothetical protein [Clostridium botulinum]
MVISNGMFEMDIEDLLITDKQENKYKIKYINDNKCVISDFENKIIKITTLDEIKRVCSNIIEDTRDMDVKQRLEEMYVIKEEYLIKNGIIILKNIPLKDSKVYVEFEDNAKILQIDTKGNKEISVPKEYVNYKNTIYCTYKIKDWVDTVTINADKLGIALENIKGCDTY